MDDRLVEFISNISEVIKQKKLTRVKLKIDDITLEVENKEPVAKVVAVPSVPVPSAVVASPPTEAVPAEAAEPVVEDEGLEEIVSPIIGTYYSAPAPKDPPFIKVGDPVDPGKTLCIVEAMKVMNKINSKLQGRVHSIEVKNGDLVQTGQVLIRIKPD